MAALNSSLRSRQLSIEAENVRAELRYNNVSSLGHHCRMINDDLVFEAVRARVETGDYLDERAGLPGVDTEGGGAFESMPPTVGYSGCTGAAPLNTVPPKPLASSCRYHL